MLDEGKLPITQMGLQYNRQLAPNVHLGLAITYCDRIGYSITSLKRLLLSLDLTKLEKMSTLCMAQWRMAGIAGFK